MKQNRFFLSAALILVSFVALLACVLVRAFLPAWILPDINIPNLVLVSLAALVLDHYVTGGAKRCYICIPVFAALTFGLLPFAACFVGAGEALKLGVAGGIIFTATTWLFSSVQDRLSTGPAAKAAPVVSAFGLYLASQCFMGMFL
jgi:hypothetical protein